MDAAPAAEQFLLFRDSASLVRINSALNKHRFYRMEIWPDLFGRVLLMRQRAASATMGIDGYTPTRISGYSGRCCGLTAPLPARRLCRRSNV